MYSKVKSRRATLDAKKQQQAQEEKEKSKSKRHQKKAKKDRRGRKPKDHKKDKKSKKGGIDLDLFGSLESATQKTLSMSPSVLDRSENSANLFRSSSLTNSEEILTVAKLEEKSRLSSSPSQSDKVQAPTGSKSPTGSTSSSSGSSSSTVMSSPTGSDWEGGSGQQPSLTAKLAEASLRDQEELSQESSDVNRSETSSVTHRETGFSIKDLERLSSQGSANQEQSVTHRETGFSIKDLERLSSQGSSSQGSVNQEQSEIASKEQRVSDWSIDRVLSTPDTQQDQSRGAVSTHAQNVETDVTMKPSMSTEQRSISTSSVEPMVPAEVSHVESQQHQAEMVRPPATSPQHQQQQQQQFFPHQAVMQQQQQQQQQQHYRRASYPGMSPQPHMSPQQMSPQMMSPHHQQVSPQVVAPPQMSPHQQQMSPHHQQISPTLPYPVDHMGRGQQQQQQVGVRMMNVNQVRREGPARLGLFLIHFLYLSNCPSAEHRFDSLSYFGESFSSKSC